MVPEIWRVTDNFFISDHFLPFYPPPNNPKNQNQNFEKTKKNCLEISFYTCVP